jgi:oxaloacetate decarboxylase alpha subunit
MARRVGLIDTTLRDGSQSLWATRMTTAMMLPILPLMDEAGYDAIEAYSTVHFDTAVRFLKEDPWERMRLIRERLKKTRTRILGMSQSFSISRVLSDDVVELFNRTCAKNGTDEFWITAALNDTRTAEVSIRTVKSMGLRADGGIQFTESPVHTDEFFANVAREFAAMGVDGIVIKDASGLLTPERARTLVPAIMVAAPGLPVICHSHCVTGLGPAANLEAVARGVSAIWTCAHPLANGSSLPSGDSMIRNLRFLGYDVAVDPEIQARVSEYWRQVATRHDKPMGEPAEYDPAYYQHQMPGGMISNFEAQLDQLGLRHRLPEVLEEIPQVRKDLGYPNMQTPYSQFLATQALLNVLHGRYEVVPDEVRNMALGMWGRPPGPVDPDVLDKIAKGQEPVAVRPGSLIPPTVDRVRAELGSKVSDEDLLLSLFFMPQVLSDLKEAGPINLDDPLRGSALVELVRGVAAGGKVKSFSLVQPA